MDRTLTLAPYAQELVTGGTNFYLQGLISTQHTMMVQNFVPITTAGFYVDRPISGAVLGFARIGIINYILPRYSAIIKTTEPLIFRAPVWKPLERVTEYIFDLSLSNDHVVVLSTLRPDELNLFLVA